MWTIKKATTIFYIIVRIITILLFGTSLVRIILSKDLSFTSEYVFIALNALVLFILSLIPYALKKLKFQVPYFILNIYLIFIVAGFLFGEIAGFYRYIPWWDDMLHFSSGGLITLVGFSVIYLLNQKQENFHLSPYFVVLFSFCIAMTCGVLWEIIEFTIDFFAGSNMQRFKNSITGEEFVGQLALWDTMFDFILNASGALIMSILGYLDLKFEKNIFEKFLIKKQKPQEEYKQLTFIEEDKK